MVILANNNFLDKTPVFKYHGREVKKEVLISIIIGVVIGLIVTFFVYKTQFSGKETNAPIISPLSENKTPNVSPTPFVSQTLSLVSPIDQSISSVNQITISGITTPSSWIIILGEKGEKVVRADEKGNFETILFLASGENEIQIKAINEKGEEIVKTVTVVFSTAEI